MATPRFSATITAERPDGLSRLSQALKIVVAMGIVVFSLATTALARDLIVGNGVDEVALFWSAWALVAASLALILLRLPR